MIKNKISGFSVVELLIIISIVAALLIVAAPSFYGIFKRQFIVYDTNKILQKDYYGDFVTASLDYYLDIINIFIRLLTLNRQN